MRTQGNQVIQLGRPAPKLLIEQAKEERNRRGACPVGDDHQHPPVSWVQSRANEQLIICGGEQFLYLLSGHCRCR